MYSKLLENIYKYDKIFIHSHVNPDGDSLGSSFGLYHIIRENFPNKRVYVASDKSVRLSFIGEVDIVSEEMYNDSLSIIVDVPVTDRISNKLFSLSETIIKLDHHQNIEQFATYEIVDSNVTSTSELVVAFAVECNLNIPKEAATALYTGIYTDTNGFKIKGVTPKTLKSISILLEAGADHLLVHESLETSTIEFMKFKGYFYNNFILEGDTAYIIITNDIINQYNVTMEDASDLVNELGKVTGINKWILFREEKNGYKARIRSRHSRIDLIANKYGGGGHKLASGCSIKDEAEMKALLQDIQSLE